MHITVGEGITDAGAHIVEANVAVRATPERRDVIDEVFRVIE